VCANEIVSFQLSRRTKNIEFNWLIDVFFG